MGATYDIHIRGADETFPHCENILAINKAFSGQSGANYRINAELVLVDGRKMSRSLNNELLIAQIKQGGYSGRDTRFFLLGMHYRKPVNYSEGALRTAKNTVKKINIFICRLKTVNNDSKNSFAEIDQLIYDLKCDFMAAFFDFIGKVNSPLTQDMINKSNARKILIALENINEVLGVMDF